MTRSIAECAADSVLGSLLTYYSPKLVTRIQATGVLPIDFGPKGSPRQAIYRAILKLHHGGHTVDAITVEAFLQRHGWLERAGGRAQLELLVALAVPSSVVEHAREVAREGDLRRFRLAWEAGGLALDRRDCDAFLEVVERLTAKRPNLQLVEDVA